MDEFFTQEIELMPYNYAAEELEPGSMEFPFSYKLPYELPSSWRAKSGAGFIEYSGNVEIDVPMGFDKNFRSVFLVRAIRDLNDNSEKREPVEKTGSREVGCCCFTSGKVFSTCSIEKAGFLAGEKVEVQIDINNQTSKVLNVSVKLLEHHSFPVVFGGTRHVTDDKLSQLQPGQKLTS